jgi:hypothetical protein
MLITYHDVIQIVFKHNVKLKAMFSFSSPDVTWETLLVNSLEVDLQDVKSYIRTGLMKVNP